MYMKTCTDCGKVYEASGPAGRYCEDCTPRRKELQKLKNKVRAEKRRRKAGAKIGQGAPAGAAHPNYRHGYYVAQTQCRKYKVMMQHTCERCGKDLENSSQYGWVMHHKDHDHANHDLDNLELLCKLCHQLEHRCQDNLKVQRLSREGVGPSGPKRLASLEDDDIV